MVFSVLDNIGKGGPQVGVENMFLNIKGAVGQTFTHRMQGLHCGFGCVHYPMDILKASPLFWILDLTLTGLLLFGFGYSIQNRRMPLIL